MEAQKIRNIITGYESQLANAEINNNNIYAEWLKAQIAEGGRYLAQFGTYES